jgi:UDP-N-acetyl-alpha-D-muramoyl-L-alanyl-L-glutamate epimerase
MDVRSFRSQFPVFEYQSFSIEERAQDLFFRFKFHAAPSLSFSPEVCFVDPPPSWKRLPADALRNCAFHLGLIELLSYWKATCSPTIRIQAGPLMPAQIEWHRDLLMNGMGEFFYRNDINFTGDDFVQIDARAPAAIERACYTGSLSDRSLVMIGGGRDSAFTSSALQHSGMPFTCMMLNPIPASLEIARATGSPKPIVVRRKILPELLDLNKRGFLNGHTPFSAYLAFLTAACLLIYDYSRVVVANERSSDEENVVYRGAKINHQYSKSFRFESLFDEYLQQHLLQNGRYFSFVRPLYEIQIARAFAALPELFAVFRSCNRNQSQNSWCGRCPKCLSVFMTMHPFVSSSDLMRIFGQDLYQAEESIRIIRALVGMDGPKPFECVGITHELIAALWLSVRKQEGEGAALPIALRYAHENILPLHPEAGDWASTLLDSYGPHRLPPDFEAVLRKYAV